MTNTEMVDRLTQNIHLIEAARRVAGSDRTPQSQGSAVGGPGRTIYLSGLRCPRVRRLRDHVSDRQPGVRRAWQRPLMRLLRRQGRPLVDAAVCRRIAAFNRPNSNTRSRSTAFRSASASSTAACE